VGAFRRAYVAAAIAWTIALPLGAWIASRAHASGAASALAIAIYGIGGVVCHQLRERSFHLWSAQLPVCARCTGVYLGAAIGVAVPAIRPSEAGPSKLGPYRARTIVIAAAMPSLATLVYEWTTGDMPSNWIRFAAGLPLGVAASWLMLMLDASAMRRADVSQAKVE
jgi:uncharacterized membrane protein